jgi:hypothetical protein
MTKYPVQYPTACSPQAWSTGAPLVLLATMLGLEPVGEHLLSGAGTARALATARQRGQPDQSNLIQGQAGLAAITSAHPAPLASRCRTGSKPGPWSSWWLRLMAALISDRWVKAWGKLPSCSPVWPISSAYSPRWLA